MVTAIVVLPFTSCEKNEIVLQDTIEESETIQTRDGDPAAPPLSDDFAWQSGYPIVEADENDMPVYMFLEFAWSGTMLPPDGHVPEFIVEIYEVECWNRKNVIGGPAFTTTIPAYPGEVSYYTFETEITGMEPGKCYALKITTPEGTVIWEWASFVF